MNPDITPYVYIENIKSGAKYSGKLSAVNRKKNKFCLTDLFILTREYQIKAVHKHIEKRKRWFSFDTYVILEKTMV
jgi:hypothetical protein